MIKLKSLLLNEESLRPEDLCLTSAGKKIEDFNDLNLKCKEKFFNWAVAERSSTVNINYGWDSSTQLYQVMSSSAGKKNLIHCYGMFKTAFYGDFGLKLQDDGTMGLDDTDTESTYETMCSNSNQEPVKQSDGTYKCMDKCKPGFVRDKKTGKCVEKSSIISPDGEISWTSMIFWSVVGAFAFAGATKALLYAIPGPVKSYLGRKLNLKLNKTSFSGNVLEGAGFLTHVKGFVLGAETLINMVGNRGANRFNRFIRQFENPKSAVYQRQGSKIPEAERKAAARGFATAHKLQEAMRDNLYNSLKRGFQSGRLSLEFVEKCLPVEVVNSPKFETQFKNYYYKHLKQGTEIKYLDKNSDPKAYQMFMDVLADAQKVPISGGDGNISPGQGADGIVPDEMA